MGLIKKYEIKIKGMQPLVWNVMKKDLYDEQKKIKKNELAEWDLKTWQRKAEVKGDKVVIPSRWLRSALINACKRTRLVPHFATKKNETYTTYFESVMLEGDPEVCKLKDLIPYGAFVGAQGKNSSTKVWRTRPLIERWEGKFLMIDPYGRINIEELKELVDHAGAFVGIGDGRNMNFGRFELETIKEVK